MGDHQYQKYKIQLIKGEKTEIDLLADSQREKSCYARLADQGI